MLSITDSLLSKDGFIKSYSKPSNPSRAKNFTNPPDYAIYFEHSQARKDFSPPVRPKAVKEGTTTVSGASLREGSPADRLFRKGPVPVKSMLLYSDELIKEQERKSDPMAAAAQTAKLQRNPFGSIPRNKNAKKALLKLQRKTIGAEKPATQREGSPTRHYKTVDISRKATSTT